MKTSTYVYEFLANACSGLRWKLGVCVLNRLLSWEFLRLTNYANLQKEDCIISFYQHERNLTDQVDSSKFLKCRTVKPHKQSSTRFFLDEGNNLDEIHDINREWACSEHFDLV